VDLALDPLSLQGLADDTSTVVLDDFSDGTDIWNLHGLFGGGYWWIAAAGDLTQVFGVAGAWNSVTGDGQSHWISFRPDLSGISNAWANVGLDFGVAAGPLPELSRMQALRLVCRGTGSWTFTMVEQLAASTRHWNAGISLDTGWTTVRIPATSLADSGLVWSAGTHRVKQIMFQTTGSGTLEIREVALEGVSLSNWSK